MENYPGKTRQIGKYIFNDCNICINPERQDFWINKYWYARLRWCDCGNGWFTYSFDLSYGDGGHSFGCNYADDKCKEGDWHRGYKSKKVCLLKCCDDVINEFEHIYEHNNINAKRLVKMITDYKKSLHEPKVVQLELFN